MVMDVVPAYLAAIAVLGLFSYSSSAAVAVATTTHGLTTTAVVAAIADAREALATVVADVTNPFCKLPLCKVWTFLGSDLF